MYLIALSGGADSVCLLLKLLEQGKVGAAAHCNFHLRGSESNRDEAFVRQLCAERGVRLFVTHFDTQSEAQKTGESIEMVARRLRYEWFAQLIEQLGLEGVAVGHHQEDNAETLLLNLIRGTGLNGLMGMQTISHKQGFCIYRPLLAYTKADILSYLKAQNQSYVTDSTNADTHYRRNKIRHEVLPLLQTMNPQVMRALTQMAQHLTGVDAIYQVGVKHLLAACGYEPLAQHSQYAQLQLHALQQLPQRFALLHEVLSAYGFTAAQVADALQMRCGGMITTNKGLVCATNKHLIFGPLPTPFKTKVVTLPLANAEQVVNSLGDNLKLKITLLQRNELNCLKCAPNELNIDFSKIKGVLKIRSVEPADRFSPFGMKGTQLVSDFLTNQHASRLDKLMARVLTDDEGILWLVGYRADNRTRLSDHTQQVLHLNIVND